MDFSSKWLADVRALFALLLMLGAFASPAKAQATRPSTGPAAAEELVSLNLPDNAPLKVLLEYVSQEFGINILYDEAAANQRVTIKAPVRVPEARRADAARRGAEDEGPGAGRRGAAGLEAGRAADAGGPARRGAGGPRRRAATGRRC